MGRRRLLPDDEILLRERDIEGLGLEEIAARWGVHKSTVSRAFTNMRRPFGGNAALPFKDIIPWDISRPHMASDAAIRLRTHIKFRAGLEVPDAQMRRLENWWERLRESETVLTYAPTSNGPPWTYVPREASDGRLVIRWPNGVDQTPEQIKLLSLPNELALKTSNT